MASDPDLRLVSVSIDPDRDTPPVLARYAARFHADPDRWLFLTGEERAIFALARDGFHMAAFAAPVPAATPTALERAFPDEEARRGPPAAAGADGLFHDPRFALVDRDGRIRGYYSSLDPEAVERLVRDVKNLLAGNP
jgi:protein SCO1/2